MTSLNIYLNFDGNCEEAFNFYKACFGGDFLSMSRFDEMPPQDGMPPLPEDHLKRIMHVSLPISDEAILMGSDTGGEWATDFKQGNNFSISINASSKEEADRLFNALSDGGNISMPMAETFWESYFGMLTDKFGINWMVSVELSGKN